MRPASGAALRRALGDGRPGHRYIASVTGLGYRFVAPVHCTDTDGIEGESPSARSSGLPQAATRLVGRADVVSALVRALPERRMVSITGAGGIGKTSVALAVAALARGQALTGRRGEALATLDGVLALCEQSAERWFLPEVLRIKGQVLREGRSPATYAEAERLFRQSMALAQRQHALSLELRAAISLAELLIGCDRAADAAGLVGGVRARFTEGRDTADLKRAAQLDTDLHKRVRGGHGNSRWALQL